VLSSASLFQMCAATTAAIMYQEATRILGRSLEEVFT